MSDRLILPDGSTWPNPDSDLEWRLRYAPDRGAELSAAAVCAVYRDLIKMSRRKREEKIRMIRGAAREAGMRE